MVSSASLPPLARYCDFVSVARAGVARLVVHAALQLTVDCPGLAGALRSFTFSYAWTNADWWAARWVRVDSL